MRKYFFALVFAFIGLTAAKAQDLHIDFRYNVSAPDAANYLTYKSAIRYIEANRDSFDALTGASMHKSTSIFAPIQYDIMGRSTMSVGFRGMLLFAVSPDSTRIEDNFTAYRDGRIIVIEYAHRGVAHRIQTDRNGNIAFPRGDYIKRTIGYIRGAGPQVISSDFSSDNTAATIDWRKVWDPATPSGNIIRTGEADRTGPIQSDYGDIMAMFNWDGVLQAELDNSILTIKGTLRPVKR
jgi:hypothetical protein